MTPCLFGPSFPSVVKYIMPRLEQFLISPYMLMIAAPVSESAEHQAPLGTAPDLDPLGIGDDVIDDVGEDDIDDVGGRVVWPHPQRIAKAVDKSPTMEVPLFTIGPSIFF